MWIPADLLKGGCECYTEVSFGSETLTGVIQKCKVTVRLKTEPACINGSSQKSALPSRGEHTSRGGMGKPPPFTPEPDAFEVTVRLDFSLRCQSDI